jgi:hypothetical protein
MAKHRKPNTCTKFLRKDYERQMEIGLLTSQRHGANDHGQ